MENQIQLSSVHVCYKGLTPGMQGWAQGKEMVCKNLYKYRVSSAHLSRAPTPWSGIADRGAMSSA